MAPIMRLDENSTAISSSLPASWVETSAFSLMQSQPLVSVLMIVYNHQPYLAEAITSIVTQECEFPFELIIGEDHSADDSLEIALEYQRLYPDIIRVLHGGPNIGMNANSRRVRAASRGNFLAWCEGDDYWCDKRKIAAQANILQSCPEVGAVHTNWVKSRLTGSRWEIDWARDVHRRVPLALLEGDLSTSFFNPLILRTCTLMFRRLIADQIDASVFGKKNYDFGDSVTSLFITASWKVAYLPVISAVYRLSPASALRSGVNARIKFLKSSLQFDADARAYMGADSRYPDAYKWELLVGIALWSVRGRDGQSLRFAARRLLSDFTIVTFTRAAMKTLWLRRKVYFSRRVKAATTPPCSDA